jgi:plastocyanin domain-containing protein
MLATWLILAGGVTAIAWVNWYFFLAPKSAAAARTGAGGVQEVDVLVEGGYSPSVIQVEVGRSVRLIFDRKEKSPCSDELVISKFGIRRFLKPFEKTVVEFTPERAGTFTFACGMNMLRGEIQVNRA